MNNNMQPIIKTTTKIPFFRRAVLQNFPFIEQDFDALTDYELLCKVVEYLNKVIVQTNLMEDNENELVRVYNELYNYVENYFDNLDVQEEINNKLDEMASDGTLQEIIAEYLNSKAIFGFDNVASMKEATNLINGSYTKTLGYYVKNDGGSGLYKIRTITNEDTVDNGSIIPLNDNTLVAELIIIDNEVNVKQFGAYGDNVHDDTVSIQNALNSNANIIFLNSGDYKITSTLIMPFNKIFKGATMNSSSLIVDNLLNDNYTIQYGTSYEYGKKNGVIENIYIKNINSQINSCGIYIYSGINIKKVYMYRLKTCIKQEPRYIDNILLENVSFGYCTPNENDYLINFKGGNKDELQLKNITINNDVDVVMNDYNAIYIGLCSCGIIENSVIHTPIILEKCTNLELNNIHTENKTNYIKIINSKISINNYYKWKRTNGSDIIIVKSNDEQLYCNNVNLSNILFRYDPYIIYDNQYLNEIEFNSNINNIIINNVYRYFDFQSKWRNTDVLTGVLIKNNNEFNKHSSYYSVNSILTSPSNVSIDIPRTPSDLDSSNFFTYSNSTNVIPFLEQGFDEETTQYIAGVYCFDFDRKLALAVSGTNKNVNVKSATIENGVITDNGKGIQLNVTSKFNSKGLELIYYRGNEANSYNKITRIPIAGCDRLFDFGTNVNGYATEDREAGSMDDFNVVTKCETKGENVIFYKLNAPTVGTFVKGDICYRSRMETSNPIGWVYDGTQWVSLGNYA